MAARLLFFYGRAPSPTGDWLDLPTGRLWMYVEHMEKLEAEHSLTHVMNTAAGSGSMPPEKQAEYMQNLQRGVVGAKAMREMRRAGSEAMIAGLGVEVETVE